MFFQKRFCELEKNQKLLLQKIKEKNSSFDYFERKYYEFRDVIDTGSFGIVHKAVLIGSPNFNYAIKSLSKSKITDIEMIQSEIETLQKMDHPNVVKIFENWEDEEFLHIVMEFCQGLNLQTFLENNKFFEEKQVQKIIQQALIALNYMHLNGYVHRDIKPANFIFDDNGSNSEIKIIDFGFALKFATDLKSELVGSPFYMAPEIIRGDLYGPHSDMWSIGVCMYVFLSGNYPFVGENQEELFENICHANFQFVG